MQQINLISVIIAAVSSFVLGGLWYSPALFGKTWVRLSGAPEQPGHPAKVFGLAFVFSLIAALAFALLLGPAPELVDAVVKGLMVGACLVAACFGINYQFADRPMAMWLIDGGYHTVQFGLFGLVLGLWH